MRPGDDAPEGVVGECAGAGEADEPDCFGAFDAEGTEEQPRCQPTAVHPVGAHGIDVERLAAVVQGGGDFRNVRLEAVEVHGPAIEVEEDICEPASGVRAVDGGHIAGTVDHHGAAQTGEVQLAADVAVRAAHPDVCPGASDRTGREDEARARHIR